MLPWFKIREHFGGQAHLVIGAFAAAAVIMSYLANPTQAMKDLHNILQASFAEANFVGQRGLAGKEASPRRARAKPLAVTTAQRQFQILVQMGQNLVFQPMPGLRIAKPIVPANLL